MNELLEATPLITLILISWFFTSAVQQQALEVIFATDLFKKLNTRFSFMDIRPWLAIAVGITLVWQVPVFDMVGHLAETVRDAFGGNGEMISVESTRILTGVSFGGGTAFVHRIYQDWQKAREIKLDHLRNGHG